MTFRGIMKMKNILSLIIAVFLLSITSITPVSAADEQAELSEADQELMVGFLNGNILWTMFHEAGHALVSLNEIPILAKEEDAVDNFATIMMILMETPETDELLKDVAYSWFLLDEFANKEGYELDFADEHSLDLQRGYQIICMLYGADQDKFGKFTEMMSLPEARTESCAYDFAFTLKNWSTVFTRLAIEDGEENAPISIAYNDTSEPLGHYKEFLEASEVLESIRDLMLLNFKMPESISIEAKTCNTANAYWDPEEKKVILCYELVAEFEKLYRFDMKQLEESENS